MTFGWQSARPLWGKQPPGPRDGRTAALLFVAVLVLYNLNGREIPSYDSQPSKFAARELIQRGTITLNYGFTNATTAILVVSAIIFVCGLPIAYYAAKCGVDIDLLTRGAGFGYIGSTITSLIYATFTFIFFAIEAVIMRSLSKEPERRYPDVLTFARELHTAVTTDEPEKPGGLLSRVKSLFQRD